MKSFRLEAAAAALVALLIIPSLVAASDATTTTPTPAETIKPAEPTLVPVGAALKPCRWWERRRNCEQPGAIEGLPPEAPREGVVVTIDATHNSVYLFRDGELLAKGPAATGTDKVLKKGLRIWMFYTPRGRMKVLRKVENPVWVKPDWAFVEEGKAVPPPDSKQRLVEGYLGRYALDLGDGIMIHGTKDIGSLGKKASHGCVRLSDEMLEMVYRNVEVGTSVYVY